MGILKAAFIYLVLVLQLAIQADVYLVTDFDGTWSGDDYAEGGKEGTWSTYYSLYRVNETSHPLARVPTDAPDQILISHRDYERVQQQLAQREGLSGSLLPVPLRDAKTLHGQSLTEFVPGFYYVVDPLSFLRFRGSRRSESNPNHQNFLLEDYRRAVTVAALDANNRSHRGLGEAVIRHFLSDPNLARGVRVLTARGADDLDWAEMFAAMQELDGYKFVPITRQHQATERPKGVVALGHPEYANLLGRSLLEKKIGYLRYLTDRLLKKQPLELVLGPDGQTYGYFHTLIFQDNDPQYLLAAYEIFKNMATARRHKIKFVLRNTGTPEEVEQTKWFRSTGVRDPHTGQVNLQALRDIVITQDGTIREAGTEDLRVSPMVAREAAGLVRRQFVRGPEGQFVPVKGSGAYKTLDGDDCEDSFEVQ